MQDPRSNPTTPEERVAQASKQFKSEEEMLEAMRREVPQAGQAELRKGKQLFYIPICSKCGNYTKSSKKFGTAVAAWNEANGHIKRYHAASQ